MKIVGYARVSTKEQSYESQIDQIKDFAKKNNHKIIELFKEKISGVNAERTEFKRLMDMATKSKFDAVVVTKLDRFSRSISDLLMNLDELQKHDIKFISLSHNIDTSTPMGRLFLQILGAIAEFERELIKERTLEGRMRAKLKGTRSGKPMHRPKKDLPEDKIKELFTQKKISINQIAKFYDVAPGTIWNRLRDMGVDTSI